MINYKPHIKPYSMNIMRGECEMVLTANISNSNRHLKSVDFQPKNRNCASLNEPGHCILSFDT